MIGRDPLGCKSLEGGYSSLAQHYVPDSRLKTNQGLWSIEECQRKDEWK